MAMLLVLTMFMMLMGGVAPFRPVILMHGILSSAKHMERLASFIKSAHPGTEVLNVDIYPDFDSAAPMWQQLLTLEATVRPLMKKHPQGVNMVCFSQGALLCRVLIEHMSDHNVRVFVSLAGPQAGIFGIPDDVKEILGESNSVSLKNSLYREFYTKLGQQVSLANYWRDPRHEGLYRRTSKFLPYFDSSTPELKSNFLRLEKLVLLGGPADGVIKPWQSSFFGFYNSKGTLVPFRRQEVFSRDTFGLRTLYRTNRLIIHVLRGVRHSSWTRDRAIFLRFIKPYLK